MKKLEKLTHVINLRENSRSRNISTIIHNTGGTAGRYEEWWTRVITERYGGDTGDVLDRSSTGRNVGDVGEYFY